MAGKHGVYVAPKDIYEYIVKVDGADVTNIVGQTDIYQDVFSPVWTASLAMSDTENLLMTLPIKVGSKVEITVETRPPNGSPCTGKKRFIFYVYKINNFETVKERHTAYVLNCVAKEFFVNEKKRVSKYFLGSPSSIASQIISTSGMGMLSSTGAERSYSLIIPNMSPFSAVEYMASFAKGASGSDFLFYQSDIGGQFKFNSVESMFKEDSGLEFKQQNPNYRDEPTKDKDEAFINIENIKFLNNLDTVSNFSRGFFGSKVINHDIIKKQLKTTTYSYSQDNSADVQNKPFTSGVFEDAEDSSISYMPVHPEVNQGRSPNQDGFEWKPSRKSNSMKLETNRVLIDIPGHACLYKSLGKMCKLRLPSQQTLTEEKEDKYLKGAYLITAIRHTISNNTYHMTMECVKKRLNKPLE